MIGRNEITDEHAREYAATSEKFLFVIDLCSTTATRYDTSPAHKVHVDAIENELEEIATTLGLL